jgi:ankyrin repeat protein
MRHSTLRSAIVSNDLAAFERLLSEGAAPDDGATPTLLEIAAYADRGRMAMRLIEAGARASDARLALNSAARHGDVLLVRALLDAGAPDRESNHEMGPGSKRGFPLACAARGGSLACVVLLSSRLDVGDGETEALTEIASGIAFDLHDRITAERRRETLAVIDHLASRGADATELAHGTIAHTSQVWLLEKALDVGASPRAVVTSTGRTLLHVAAARLSHRMIALLLRRGADRDARDHHGATPSDVARTPDPDVPDAVTAQRLSLSALGGDPPRAAPAPPAPAPARGALRAGARVRHPTLGHGTVLKVLGDIAQVRFSATVTAEVPCAEITTSR